MNPVLYLKEHGVKYTFETIYKYKADRIIQSLMKPFLKNKPLKNIIVIESHNDFDSNGGALYNYLIDHKYNEKYKIVWLIKHPEYLKGKMPNNVTCIPQYTPGLRKNYYKWIAKWFTNDHECSAKLRADQVSIYMTHGAVGLKDTTGAIVLPDNLNYVLTASEWWKPYDAKQYIINSDDMRLKICGFPVHDYFYTDSLGDLDKITKRKFCKVVLWMPTFRKTSRERNDSNKEQPLGIPLIETIDEYETLNSYLNKNNMLLILKIHPKQDPDILKICDMENIKVLTADRVKKLGIDNYRLMKDVDALVSDYSSVVYEFLHLNRPVAYDLSDLESYNRGIIVSDPKEMMAGNMIKKIDDLYVFLDAIKDGKDPYVTERKELFDRLFKFHDGNSCKRVVELLGL